MWHFKHGLTPHISLANEDAILPHFITRGISHFTDGVSPDSVHLGVMLRGIQFCAFLQMPAPRPLNRWYRWYDKTSHQLACNSDFVSFFYPCRVADPHQFFARATR